VATGELYTFSELCGHWLAVWSLASWVTVSDLRTLASCVAMGKLYTVDKPYIAGELGGRWLVMWSLASCVAGGKLFGSVVLGRFWAAVAWLARVSEGARRRYGSRGSGRRHPRTGAG
jgi:hypothetical protein